MASKLTKKNNDGANLYSEEGPLNNGQHYLTSNRRHGPQCLNVVHNDLSEDDTSGCSDTDDADGICEGCNNDRTLYWCEAYQCGVRHMFCGTCCNYASCPCDSYPRKRGY